MERIHDLSEAEVLKLTDEQITRYIDVECVLGGIPLIPTVEPVEPDVVKPEPDSIVYKIGSIEFADENEAVEVLKLIMKSKLVDRRYNSINGETFYTIGSAYSDPAITREKAFSKEAWVEAERQAKEYGATIATYKAQKKEYDAAVTGREKVSEEVWTIVMDARRRNAQKEMLEREFARYVNLADGDKYMAWKFFTQAHPEAEEYEELEEQLVYADKNEEKTE